MKIIASLLAIILFYSSAVAEEKTYTGSTPAGAVVRSFLGISMEDSVDFIRWQLEFHDHYYTLSCNYGIGKPNTNGFIDDGKKVAFAGELKKDRNNYEINNGNKILRLAELNADLLHILDADDSLVVGNGGWSYTLNNTKPSMTSPANITARPTIFKDSMTFEGRTPCNVPGIIPPGIQCYKLKWYIVFYAGAENNTTGTYKVSGTPYRKDGKTGTWKTVTEKKGETTYLLNDDDGNGFLYLLKLDEHILVFTDSQGRLLVGDGDFSYTLNRIAAR